MSRIKKKGLDYMPLDVFLLSDRRISRLMDDEDVHGPMVFMNILMHIYREQGSYLVVDRHFYRDLSRELHRMPVDKVERIVKACVDAELFDERMWREKGVLTSEDIQQQYLHVMRRRRHAEIPEEYRLISADDARAKSEETNTSETAAKKPAAAAKTEKKTQSRKKKQTVDAPSSTPATETVADAQTVDVQNDASSSANVAQYVTNCPHSIAQHSIAQHSIAKHSKEYPPSSYGVPPQDEARHHDEAGRKEEGIGERNRDLKAAGQASGPLVAAVARAGDLPEPGSVMRRAVVQQAALQGRSLRGLTSADIAALTPPDDGEEHNLDGLRKELDRLRVTPDGQYRLIVDSRFGRRYATVFRGIHEIRESGGRIRMPEQYLLKRCAAAPFTEPDETDPGRRA